MIQEFIANYTAWFVVICVVAGGLLILAALWIYGLGRSVTEKEKARTLPGDDLFGAKEPKLRYEAAITINAPREKVWPYLAQLGQRRAGFYSFSALERLTGFHIFNTYTIVDEWQNMYEGEYIFYHQNGIGSEVKELKVGEYFTTVSDTRKPSKVQGAIAFKPPFALKHFGFSWNFFLFEEGPGKTRFFTRCDCTFAPFTGLRKWLVILILGTPSFVMGRHMMDVVKKCAEGRKKEPGQWLRKALS